MFDMSSMLPLLMSMNNKDGDSGNKSDMMLNMMQAMNGGGNSDIMNIMNAMNNKASVNQTAHTQTAHSQNNAKTTAFDNCREPNFWNSPARDANSLPPIYPNLKEERTAGFGNNASGANSGNNSMDMLASMMGGDSKLAPLLSMMNGGGAGGAGGTGGIMSMLPLLSMMNNKGGKASVAANKSDPLAVIEKICPLDTRMRIHYFLTGKKNT